MALHTGKIRSLELLRAVAALLVVLFHTQTIFDPADENPPFWGMFGQGARGVDLFFVLSGFIIAYVHGSDLGRPDSLSNYLFNRVARIYPAVWIVSAIVLVPYSFGYGGAEKASKLAFSTIVASILLLPQRGVALVTVMWTLKYEMFFYVLFAIAIINRRIGLSLLVLWQAATAVVALSGADLGFSGYYLRSICLDFSVGLACAWLVRHTGQITSKLASSAMAASGIICFVLGMVLGPVLTWSGALCGLGAGLIIVGLVNLERTANLPVANLFITLGGASYAIYLVHYPVLTMVYNVLAHFGVPTSNPLCLVCAATGVLAGVVFDRFVDRPIQRWLRRQKRILLSPVST